jgi:hypothetical protein
MFLKALIFVLFPLTAFAEGISGVWSSIKDENYPNAIHRVVIVDTLDDKVYFDYVSDYHHRCEVIGMAEKKEAPSGTTAYIFSNDKAHQISPGHENYGFEENEDCQITFTQDVRVLKVSTSGNCRSFCGATGGIGGELYKVPDENLTTAARGHFFH